MQSLYSFYVKICKGYFCKEIRKTSTGSCWASEPPIRRSPAHRRVKQPWGTCWRFRDSSCLCLVRQTARQRRWRSSQRPSGRTLRRWPHQLWRGLLTSTCSKGGVGPPLVDNYAGPYLVLEKGPKFLELQLGERTEEVSRDRLKPHVGQVPLAGR